MASYYVPTVVQTTIPDTDMTPLERLVLSHIFSAEPDGDGLYFLAEDSPAECLELDVAELHEAHRASGRCRQCAHRDRRRSAGRGRSQRHACRTRSDRHLLGDDLSGRRAPLAHAQ